MRYAEIIVDISLEKLDHPFTYRIPDALRTEVVPGVRVRIPFGGRMVSGYVVNLTDTCEIGEDRVKEIAELVTGEETQESRLVALAAWMSRHYGSTMIRALKTVFPVRKRVKALTHETVSLSHPESAGETLQTLRTKKRAAQARVAELLTQVGRMDRLALEREAKVPASVIRSMETQGILTVEPAGMSGAVRGAEHQERASLTQDQAAAVGKILEEWDGDDRPVLLTGVTGSGKTLVYMALIEKVLAEGRQAIVLIPEIALTWQTVVRFVRRFGQGVSFLHSRLSEGERYDQLRAAKNGDIRILVGPRSALFAPFPDLGLIVIDEEHEDSYHSESVPRYDARETAIRRAELEGAHVVLGSATPSVSSYFKMKTGRYLGVFLNTRYGGRTLPVSRIIDMREELKAGNRSILSNALKEEMRGALTRGEQVMLFLNRRGFSGSVTCRSCGTVLKCPHCDVSLTLHRNGRLVCHYCGYSMPMVKRCPTCGSPYIGGLTVGTEQVETAVKALFPDAAVLRMDLDTTRGKEGHRKILEEFRNGGADILIGTQMIVKGHDFPHVTLVGVLLADLSLNEADYRSAERTYQLVTQAVGRAGRGEKTGLALIQTYHPDHYSIQAAARQNYEEFYAFEIAYRSLLGYPPAGKMAAVYGACRDEQLLKTGMNWLRKYMDRVDRSGRLQITGPAPQTVGKVRDMYRAVIYFRSDEENNLIAMKDQMERYIAVNSGFSEITIQFDFGV